MELRRYCYRQSALLATLSKHTQRNELKIGLDARTIEIRTRTPSTIKCMFDLMGRPAARTIEIYT